MAFVSKMRSCPPPLSQTRFRIATSLLFLEWAFSRYWKVPAALKNGKVARGRFLIGIICHRPLPSVSHIWEFPGFCLPNGYWINVLQWKMSDIYWNEAKGWESNSKFGPQLMNSLYFFRCFEKLISRRWLTFFCPWLYPVQRAGKASRLQAKPFSKCHCV